MGRIRIVHQESRAGVASSDADIHVENEIVRAQYSLDPATRLLSMMARWIAAQVMADTDPNESAAKFLSDMESVVDSLAVALNLIDAGVADDALLANLQSVLADTDGAGDSVLANIRAMLEDAVKSTDALAFVLTMTDRQAAADALKTAVQAVLADAAHAVDVVIANANPALTDTGTAADSGTAYIQTYAQDYAELDYVGDTFTY